MSRLLLGGFVVELVVLLLSRFGQAVDDFAWMVYSRGPTRKARQAADLRRLQNDLVRCRDDLHATSSQDQFAKWARLRRHHDRLAAEVEQRGAALSARRASFDKWFKMARWGVPRAVQQLVGLVFRRAAVLWLPAAWFPRWAEWLVSWPSAPMGSVSIVMWLWSCAAALAFAFDVLLPLFLRLLGPLSSSPPPPPPQPAAATAAGAAELRPPR